MDISFFIVLHIADLYIIRSLIKNAREYFSSDRVVIFLLFFFFIAYWKRAYTYI